MKLKLAVPTKNAGLEPWSSNYGRRLEIKRSWVWIPIPHRYFFKKWANPRIFFIYFRLFKHTFQILQQIGMWQNCPSSIWWWDSNSPPLENESPPITTTPGLLHRHFLYCQNCNVCFKIPKINEIANILML